MPVTARLSQRFYEQFGDELTNELVDWFNAVDATYRSDVRELNELNFARFDAKVEQRFAESDARFEERFAAWERRFDESLSQTDKRFTQMEARFEVKMEKRFADSESRMIKWMFTFWTGSTLATVGLLFTLLRGR